MRRTWMLVLGAIALVIGGVWSLQGAGVLPGSFMTGDSTWLVIGLVLVVAGVALLVLGLRRRAPRP